MLGFSLSISEGRIKPDGKARVKFSFKNEIDKIIHCLSYKFTIYKDGMVVQAFLPHEFFFNIPPSESIEREFGDVNISESYLAGNTAAGVYTIQTSVRYFICGDNKASTVISNTDIEIINEDPAE